MDKPAIDQLTAKFFDIFTNAHGRMPNWGDIDETCIPQALIIKKMGMGQEVFSLGSFVEPRRRILSDGTLTGFSEWEVSEETRIMGNIAQRFSKYQKKGIMNEQPFEQTGNKAFQFVKTELGWRICAVVWEDENS